MTIVGPSPALCICLLDFLFTLEEPLEVIEDVEALVIAEGREDLIGWPLFAVLSVC